MNEGGRTQNGVMEYWSDGRRTESLERKIAKETKVTKKGFEGRWMCRRSRSREEKMLV
jgi:hypothetical protein